jgi:hypothetical protein
MKHDVSQKHEVPVPFVQIQTEKAVFSSTTPTEGAAIASCAGHALYYTRIQTPYCDFCLGGASTSCTKMFEKLLNLLTH